MSGSIVHASLMCHAPIVIPEIAGREKDTIAKSTSAMRQVARELVDASVDGLVVVSPHFPRFQREFGVLSSDVIRGDFGQFGFPGIQIELPGFREAGELLEKCCDEEGVAVARHQPRPLDHGSLVPLFFAVEAGWNGPTLIVSLPSYSEIEQDLALGKAIHQASLKSGKSWGVIASGDMSHRLIPGAPSGYDEKAVLFDEFVTGAVERGALLEALKVDPEIRERAAEDALSSLAVALGGLAGQFDGNRFHSYEGPFGVGYLVATLGRKGG